MSGGIKYLGNIDITAMAFIYKRKNISILIKITCEFSTLKGYTILEDIKVLFVGPLIPSFNTSGEICSRSQFLLPGLYGMDFSD